MAKLSSLSLVLLWSLVIFGSLSQIQATREIESNAQKVCSPLLVVHGAADMVTDPNVNKFLYDRACSKDKTLKLYEGGYHSILVAWMDIAVLFRHFVYEATLSFLSIF
ncbi:caffeoylshikimate esterase-like isoform X2 [Silene latifolia]|uniref:caffeoylshikimate esterase-like isoform X2 n=1 Tax=Silene latifolia TaxID=37657 RepID=UPI003D77D952